MKIHRKLYGLITLIAIILLLVCTACVSDVSHVKGTKQPTADTSVTKSPESESSSIRLPGITTSKEKFPDPSETEEKQEERKTLYSHKSQDISSGSPAAEAQKKSNQEMLDSALGFCEAANDFWEQGDLENAIGALDEAYYLILQVKPDQDPEILQQTEDLRFTISKRIIEVYSSRFTVANGYHKAIPLVMNAHVEKAINLFKGREKKFFINAYRRSGRYRPYIVSCLKEAGLPEELSWLPFIESGFKIRALSRARALGMWQFIASTGHKFGLKRDTWVDERMDPEKSTKAAIAYLKELHHIFGDWTTVLAAYNCGEGLVLRRIRTQRINYLDNFWDLYNRLPSETAFYVPKFLAVLHILNNPEAYGFTLPAVDQEIKTEDVTINKRVRLKTMAGYLNISYQSLKDLNPELRHYSTPNRPYTVKVPIGKGAVLLAKISQIPAWHPPVPTHVVHRVRRGESLSTIARRHKTSIRAIMAANNLRRSHYIKAGWKLKIPVKATYASRQKAPSIVQASKAKGQIVKYVVKKGDSLWKVANRFGTTTKAIQRRNKLNNTHLSIGQVLMIPSGLTTFEKMKTKTYKVLKGDSPYMIAKKSHMNLSQFLRLNKLTPRSTIYPGQLLLVKAD